MKKNFYADCEFDGLGGPLLSLAIFNEQNEFAYFINADREPKDPWVKANLPDPRNYAGLITLGCIGHSVLYNEETDLYQLHEELTTFFSGCTPNIIVDWPDDVKYISELLITGPGTMIDIPGITFEVKRVDSYPTDAQGAIQHNALWDAYVLKEHLFKLKLLNMPLVELNTFNRNGRLIPPELATKSIEKFNNDKPLFGELGQSTSITINLNGVSHSVSNSRSEGNMLIGSIKILKTPQGKIASELLRSNLAEFAPRMLVNADHKPGQAVTRCEFITFDLVNERA